MKNVNELITLVIHTPERAQFLKSLLERHGVTAKLENFVSFQSPVVVAQRVKIEARDLSLALKVIESGSLYFYPQFDDENVKKGRSVLIPIDFLESNFESIKVGFQLAESMGISPVLMHALSTPFFAPSASLDILENEKEDELSNELESDNLRKAVTKRLNELKKDIKDQQKAKQLPAIEFTTTLQVGLAEEAILQYCNLTSPRMIVMTTRARNKKDEQLIGSVSAEVLDSCRVPVFVVPENSKLPEIKKIKNLLYFCRLDQHDIIALDSFMRLFDFPECNINVVPVADAREKNVKAKMQAIELYFKENFPSAIFTSYIPDHVDFNLFIDDLIKSKEINLLLVPNKKSNVFSRIFKPTLAHKTLFDRDMPMLAIPV